MKRAIRLWWVILMALLLAVPASARDEGDESEEGSGVYARSGFYLGLEGMGVASPLTEKEIEDQGLGGEVDINTTGAIGLYAGYRFLPNLAVEVEADYVPVEKIEVNERKLTDYMSFLMTVSAKVYLTRGVVQPYFVAGSGVGVVDETIENSRLSDSVEVDAVMRIGAGADLYASESLVLTIGIDHVLGVADLEDLDWLTFGAGLQYRF